MSKQKLLYLFITSLKHAAVTWPCMHLAGWYVVMHAAQTSLFHESWLMNVIYQSYLCKNFWTGNKKYKSPSGLWLNSWLTCTHS